MMRVPRLPSSPAAALKAPSATVLPHASAWVTKPSTLSSVNPRGPSFSHERISVSPDCRLATSFELSAIVERTTMNKIDTMAVKMITKDSTMASTRGMNLPSRFITGEARAVTRRLRKRARATGKTRFRK